MTVTPRHAQHAGHGGRLPVAHGLACRRGCREGSCKITDWAPAPAHGMARRAGEAARVTNTPAQDLSPRTRDQDPATSPLMRPDMPAAFPGTRSCST